MGVSPRRPTTSSAPDPREGRGTPPPGAARGPSPTELPHHMKHESDIRKIAFVGDYLPRKCGIATFTHDMYASVAGRYPGRRVLRRAGQRPPRGVRLPAGGPVRDRRAGPGQLPPGGRLPELREHRRRLPPARVRDLRRAGRQPHPRPAAGPADAGRHDPAHRPARAGRRPAAGPDATGRPVRPRRRHDRTGPDVPAGDLRRPRGEDRPDRPRHPRHAVRRPEPVQGPVRRRGPAGGADVRAALAQQGHRAHAPGRAGDPRGVPQLRLHRPGGDPPGPGARAGRALPAGPGAAGPGPGDQEARHLLQPVRRAERADRVHPGGGRLRDART